MFKVIKVLRRHQSHTLGFPRSDPVARDNQDDWLLFKLQGIARTRVYLRLPKVDSQRYSKGFIRTSR